MNKNKNYWHNYIKHAQILKKRYQLANSQGNHDRKIEKIEKDLQKARQSLQQCYY